MQFTDPLSQIRWLQVTNDEDETAPGFAIMRIVSVDDDGTIHVAKPDRDGQRDILVNGPVPIPAGANGIASMDSPVHVLYDSSSGTPALDQMWGPTYDSWYLTKDMEGFYIAGGIVGPPDTVLPRVLARKHAAYFRCAKVTGPTPWTNGGTTLYYAMIQDVEDETSGSSINQSSGSGPGIPIYLIEVNDVYLAYNRKYVAFSAGTKLSGPGGTREVWYTMAPGLTVTYTDDGGTVYYVGRTEWLFSYQYGFELVVFNEDPTLDQNYATFRLAPAGTGSVTIGGVNQSSQSFSGLKTFVTGLASSGTFQVGTTIGCYTDSTNGVFIVRGVSGSGKPPMIQMDDNGSTYDGQTGNITDADGNILAQVYGGIVRTIGSGGSGLGVSGILANQSFGF